YKNPQQPKRESERALCRKFFSDERADMVGLFKFQPCGWQRLAQPCFYFIGGASISPDADEITIGDLFRLNYAVLKSGVSQRAAYFIRCQFLRGRDNEQIASPKIRTEIALTLHEQYAKAQNRGDGRYRYELGRVSEEIEPL